MSPIRIFLIAAALTVVSGAVQAAERGINRSLFEVTNELTGVTGCRWQGQDVAVCQIPTMKGVINIIRAARGNNVRRVEMNVLVMARMRPAPIEASSRDMAGLIFERLFPDWKEARSWLYGALDAAAHGSRTTTDVDKWDLVVDRLPGPSGEGEEVYAAITIAPE